MVKLEVVKKLDVVKQAIAIIEERSRSYYRIMKWWDGLSYNDTHDPFFVELRKTYMDELQEIKVLEPMLDAARSFGARFISISQQDIVIYEGLETDDRGWKHPLAWGFVETLDISYGCGNGPQHQVSLWNILNYEDQGIYDLRSKPYNRIYPIPLTLHNMNWNAVEKKYVDGKPLDEYIAGCFNAKRMTRGLEHGRW